MMQFPTLLRAPGRRGVLRLCAALSLALAAGCSDGGDAFAPDPRPTPPPVFATAFDDPFDDASTRWALDTHPLGRGWVRAENVALGGGAASLALSAGAPDGAEIRSTEKFGYGSYTARMRTPLAPGTLSAFFLYEGGSDVADEIDIEIYNDGSRRVLFTTWVAGRQTNTVTQVLPFDPADGFHDYRIDRSRREVRFTVDGVEMQRWRRGVPQNAMYVMANAWWPVWLEGPALETPVAVQIDRITAGL
jgi:hypothetical protein